MQEEAGATSGIPHAQTSMIQPQQHAFSIQRPLVEHACSTSARNAAQRMVADANGSTKRSSISEVHEASLVLTEKDRQTVADHEKFLQICKKLGWKGDMVAGTEGSEPEYNIAQTIIQGVDTQRLSEKALRD